MSQYNYCYVKKNKIYEEVFDMLEMEELSMSNPDHDEKVKYELSKIIKRSKYIEIKTSEPNTEDLIAEIILSITKDYNPEGLQGNTLLVHANDDYYYEVIYMENLIDKKPKLDDDINQLATISNIDLEPILNDSAIVKTGYSDGNPVCESITIDDICEIMINNFYHKGILIDEDGNIKELTYSGDNPTIILGNKFQKCNSGDVLGLLILPWVEKSEKINLLASKILGIEIKGRVFLMTFSPITNKRHWNLSKEVIEGIIKILDDKDKKVKIYDLIDKENKQSNPFYLIKKVLNEK